MTTSLLKINLANIYDGLKKSNLAHLWYNYKKHALYSHSTYASKICIETNIETNVKYSVPQGSGYLHH